MEKIKLNFINKSNESHTPDIVIFQKNEEEIFEGRVVAWTVIQNCDPMENHPFTFSDEIEVCVSDSYGNYSPTLKAQNGSAYDAIISPTGEIFQRSDNPALSASSIEIRNELRIGAINANCFRDGKLLSVKTNLVPNQSASFEFKPTIWIGATSQAEEGESLDEAIVSSVETQLNLLGISSADIVMTGGGPGPNTTPFVFTLENIEYL